MRYPRENIPPSVMAKLTRAQKSELGLALPAVIPDGLEPVKKTKPSAEESLNQTERELLSLLRGEVRLELDHCSYTPGACQIGVQRILLTLAHRCTYTPDFDSMDINGRLVLWECKGGFKWEDSWVKLKTAATMFPAIRFMFAQKKDGQWTFNEIPKA